MNTVNCFENAILFAGQDELCSYTEHREMLPSRCPEAGVQHRVYTQEPPSQEAVLEHTGFISVCN